MDELLIDLVRLMDEEEYERAYADHPTTSDTCGYRGCRLSLAEHHRLAFGLIKENKDLKRRLEES